MGYAAANIVDFISGFGKRKEASQVKEQMKNYLTAPEQTITEVNKIDPFKGIALKDKYTGEQRDATKLAQEQSETDRKRFATGLGGMAQILGKARDNPDVDLGAVYDTMIPMFKNGLGLQDEEILEWRGKILQDPSIIDMLGQTAADELQMVSAGGAMVDKRTGKEIYRNPVSIKGITIGRGDGGKDLVTLDPETGAVNTPRSGAGSPGAGGSLDVETLRPVFKAQESNNDYTAVNKETGALGAYQVMPATGRALATRVGVAWRPDLMTSNTPEAVKYQDAIGGAAIQEAVEASGGDPATAFSYYYGGSDRKQWGPKTQKYTEEMLGRMQGGAGGGQGGPAYSTPGKPKEGYRLMSPEEMKAAGLPDGVKYQISPKGKIEAIAPTAKTGKQKLTVSPEEYQLRRSSTMASAQSTITAANDILRDPAFERATGSIQGRLPSFGQAAADFDGKVEAFRDKVVLDTIATLKSLSATGATGFGNLTEKEGKRLENAKGNLSQLSGSNLRTTVLNVKKDAMVINGYAALNGKASPDSVRMLVGNPKLAKQFDAAYGAGSANKVLGGF